MMTDKYDRILDASPWEPRSHPRMPLLKRAAQFQPFDPLEGYDEAVTETARETDAERYLDETTVASLNATLAELNARIKEQPPVTVTYFVPDTRKSGGAYRTLSGKLKKLDELNEEMTLTDGTRIPLKQIMALSDKREEHEIIQSS